MEEKFCEICGDELDPNKDQTGNLCVACQEEVYGDPEEMFDFEEADLDVD